MTGPAAPPSLWVLAVVVEDDRILLVWHGSPGGGVWSGPAAPVAADEPLPAAVVRAVEEEAGLDALCERPLGHIELLRPTHRVLLAFQATVLPGPVAGASWVDLEEVTQRPLLEGMTELLADRGILRVIA